MHDIGQTQGHAVQYDCLRYSLWTGVPLSSRAEAHQLAGDASSATASLAAAMTIAGHIGAGPASELGLAIARVRKLIEPTQD